jgi:S-adenosylmethionine:tRNA ribosyltransferase-isomerase
MDLSEFDFDLPDELIAQEPPPTRGGSRLLVMRRNGAGVEHTDFSHLVDYLRAGDLLVLNNTKVFPARLLGRRVPSGGTVECLLLRDVGLGSWEALVHPGQKLKPGARMVFERNSVRLHGEVLDRHFFGRRTIRLWRDDGGGIQAAIEAIGHIPLPPYIKREDSDSDRQRYQTVYARERGSIAAPTAGLHFTNELLDTLQSRRIEVAQLTLHVGYGTFKPIRTDVIEEHTVDSESFEVSPETVDALTRARSNRGRIIAVGTTTVRALESLSFSTSGRLEAASGETHLFIHPGHAFQVVDGLITNFHLPRSSLLVLVAAFAGRERVLDAYRDAVTHGYRFYSYGDAMLIL